MKDEVLKLEEIEASHTGIPNGTARGLNVQLCSEFTVHFTFSGIKGTVTYTYSCVVNSLHNCSCCVSPCESHTTHIQCGVGESHGELSHHPNFRGPSVLYCQTPKSEFSQPHTVRRLSEDTMLRFENKVYLWIVLEKLYPWIYFFKKFNDPSNRER